MCREVPLRNTKAVAAELGVGCFYLKLFETKLLCQCPSQSVGPIRARAYYINTARRSMKYSEFHP